MEIDGVCRPDKLAKWTQIKANVRLIKSSDKVLDMIETEK